MGKFAEAEPLYRRATEIWETALGPEHPHVATALNNRAGLLIKQVLNNRGLLKAQGKHDQVGPLYDRSLAVEKGGVVESAALNNRAELLRVQGKYEEAVPLHEPSSVIRETMLVESTLVWPHRSTTGALLLEHQGEYAEALPLYERSLAIFEKACGLDHPNSATVLHSLAGVLIAQEKYTRRHFHHWMLRIRTKKLGENHPDTVWTRNSLEYVREKVRQPRSKP
ncbi:unnamed protein product [Ectocarpus sp. CCAP 1310/34]|nr:unnamed protein product [Ectocarpus sp. CCAP 1310/34]